MKHPINHPLKLLLLSCSVLLLNACGSRVIAIADTIEYAMFGAPDVELSVEQIRDLPYAAQYVQLESEAKTALVLSFDDNGQLHWVSREQESIVTRYGRIIGMTNVDKPDDRIQASVYRVTNLTKDPLTCLTKNTGLLCPKQWSAELYTSPGLSQQRFSLKSSWQSQGQKTVELPSGYSVETELYTESVISESAGRQWQYTNHFWLEKDTGRVVKSSQQYIPGFPRANWLEVKAYSKQLKPNNGAGNPK